MQALANIVLTCTQKWKQQKGGFIHNGSVHVVSDDIFYDDVKWIWSIHLSWTQGLVVPVLRDVGGMNYAEIEKALSELGEKVTKFIVVWIQILTFNEICKHGIFQIFC